MRTGQTRVRLLPFLGGSRPFRPNGSNSKNYFAPASVDTFTPLGRHRMSSKPALTPSPATVDMKFEIVVIPVSDIDRAKEFYQRLGWRLDADYATDDKDFRVIQFTPPGSGC